jgi:hypothetical protein
LRQATPAPAREYAREMPRDSARERAMRDRPFSPSDIGGIVVDTPPSQFRH